VNTDKKNFLGFSGGGNFAIDYAFKQIVPVSGLILNCPGVPDVSDSSITAYAKNGRRLGIVTGEWDWALNDQKELLSRVRKADGIHRITINEGIGHQFSSDFSSLLDEYLIWIND